MRAVTGSLASMLSCAIVLCAGTPQRAMSQPAAPAPHIVCFYADSPHLPLPTGHGFIQLIPGSGPQAGRRDLVYGHHPKTPDPFTSGGETRSNADHTWDWKICYPVTTEQYNAIARFIRGEIDRPSDFHLFSRNCTNWIARIAGIGRIELPATTDRDTKIDDPAVFEDNLKKIGAGKTFRGGTVHENTRHVTPRNGADPPSTVAETCSYRGLLAAGFHDPLALGAASGLRAAVHASRRIAVGAGTSLTVVLRSVDRRNAITAIDYGDGTVVTQRPASTHRYASVGRYSARVLVLDRGAIELFRFPVDVSSAGSAARADIDVPPFEIPARRASQGLPPRPALLPPSPHRGAHGNAG